MIEHHRVRTTVVFSFFVLLYSIVVVYIGSLQVRSGGFFEGLAQRQYTTIITTTPPRAEIFDRHGQLMAGNKDSLAAFILPKNVEDYDRVYGFLQQNFPQAAQRYKTNRAAHFLFIKRRITSAEEELITQAGLPDIKILKEPGRFYPVSCASSIIGITDIDNKGLFGIEKAFDAHLAGKPSTMIVEKEARSGQFYFAKHLKVQGLHGLPITLTLDSALQFLVHEELKDTVELFKAKEGMAIIADPTTGHILVLDQYPTIDPQNSEHASQDFARPKAITDVYEFGSVMKTFVACAALEEGLVQSDEYIDCENKETTTLNGLTINTWKAHGKLTFSQVMQTSNNIGIAKVALRLGPKLYEHYKRFGFGSKTGLGFAGEAKGFINPPVKWSKRSIISLSYGYEINATLLQLTRAFCALAVGYPVALKIIDDNNKQQLPVNSKQEHEQKQNFYSPQTLAIVREILCKAVTEGTAYKAAVKGYTIWGKTGTARLIIDGAYVPNRNIFTFVCVVEKNNYKRVVVTCIKDAAKKNLYASSVTAPLAEKITQKMLIHERVL